MKRLALLLLFACSPSETGLRVELIFNDPLEQLSIVVSGGEKDARAPQLISDTPLESGMHLSLLVPESWDGRAARVEITGLVGGKEIARRSGGAMVRAHELVDISLCLGSACPSQCNAPPANSCLDDETLRAYVAVGTAGADGSCTYPYWDVFCQSGCSAGKCVGDDPCNNISCITPPAAICSDTHSLVTYANAGSCSAGECSYAKTTTRCAGGCDNGSCPGDPCAGIACNVPPQTTCKNESTLLSYAAGVCTDGSCSYAPVEQTCEFGCADGKCVGDPCAGVPCVQPPPTTCVNSSLRTFAPNGVCSAGSCIYTGTDTACPAPQNGNATCSAASCGFICNPGFEASGMSCLPHFSVELGREVSCAFVPGGGLKCWGWLPTGSDQLPTALTTLSSGVTAVALGWDHGCAIMNGAVYCWGKGTEGQLGDGFKVNFSPNKATQAFGLSTGATAIAVGYALSCAVVNGGAKCWGTGYLGNGPANMKVTPVDVSGLSSGVTAIAAGGQSCAVVNGGVQCWGAWGEQFSALTPVAVPGLSGVTAVASGNYHSCAIANGVVYCWGNNNVGQLGDGTTTARTQPAPITLPGVVTALDLFENTSCALASGVLYCWGQNYTQFAPPYTPQLSPMAVPGTTGSTGMAIGGTHVCVTAQGGLRCQGANNSGQLGDGSTGHSSMFAPVLGL